MPYQPFLDTMSMPRAGVYRRVFRTATVEETFGAVMWAHAMAASLQALISTFEVALRNRIHVSLSRQASLAVTGQPSDSYPWYDSTLGWKTLNGETYSKVENLLCVNGMRSKVQPPPDRVVAGLSFGVWPNILDSQLTQLQERTTFNDVFPDHPNRHRKHWNFENSRKGAVQTCKDLQHLRNRISHCKPIWQEGWFRNSTTQHWTDMLARLKTRRASFLELLSWVCQHTAHFHATSFAGSWFDQLCTQDAVLAYMLEPLTAGANLQIPQAHAPTMQGYLQRA